VSLGRLVLAWLPVAVWFTGAAFVARRLALSERAFPALTIRAGVEALLLTLLASLWFDSLGAGVWWLPASLIGALVALAGVNAQPPRTVVMLFLVDLLRYLGAAALLVWRLG
jgi:acyl-CoA synthetase (AMP-forming)/AMP-acid ligase II